MTEPNSTLDQKIRPEDLMDELGIKKDTYYGDLKHLGIRADKDGEGKAYLTFEKAERVKALRSYVNKNGKREGFENSSLVYSSNNELATNGYQEDIYVERDEPTSNFDINQIMRGAANLKARELAMPHLITREIANRMSEEDLPDELREKVAIAREVANPKWTPAEVAEKLLSQYRSQRSS